MPLQLVAVVLLVLGCAGYAAWTLMPASWRRALAPVLLKLPLPRGIAATMAKASLPSSACACDGCDKGTAAARSAASAAPQGAATAPLVFHRRLPR